MKSVRIMRCSSKWWAPYLAKWDVPMMIEDQDTYMRARAFDERVRADVNGTARWFLFATRKSAVAVFESEGYTVKKKDEL